MSAWDKGGLRKFLAQADDRFPVELDKLFGARKRGTENLGKLAQALGFRLMKRPRRLGRLEERLLSPTTSIREAALIRNAIRIVQEPRLEKKVSFSIKFLKCLSEEMSQLEKRP